MLHISLPWRKWKVNMYCEERIDHSSLNQSDIGAAITSTTNKMHVVWRTMPRPPLYEVFSYRTRSEIKLAWGISGQQETNERVRSRSPRGLVV
jgi:hypothetical protein